MHSIFSDGSMTPEELVAEGARLGLTAMALTDHDTVDGVPRFLAAAHAAGIAAITGVEVSAEIDSGTMHVIGYGVDTRNRVLIEHLRWIREGRNERNLEILCKLNRLGIRLTMEEVKRQAGADVVGRPHFSQALIAKGIVRDKREAFDRYLARGKPAYAERRRLDARAAMVMIRTAGGLPVIAHPFTLRRAQKELKALLKELKSAGLAGIEVYYTEHSAEMQRAYAALAKELGLLETGGSDFHGSMSPGIQLGKGSGALRVPVHVWEQIQAALGRSKN